MLFCEQRGGWAIDSKTARLFYVLHYAHESDAGSTIGTSSLGIVRRG